MTREQIENFYGGNGLAILDCKAGALSQIYLCFSKEAGTDRVSDQVSTACKCCIEFALCRCTDGLAVFFAEPDSASHTKQKTAVHGDDDLSADGLARKPSLLLTLLQIPCTQALIAHDDTCHKDSIKIDSL